MAEKLEEAQQVKLPAEQNRLEQEWSEPEFPPTKRQQVSTRIERNGGQEPMDRRLQEPETQRLHAEQERLRIEAERVWLEQERHFAEQARLRNEAESTEPHPYEAKIQQLIVQQHPFEPEKQLAKEENFVKTVSAAGTPLSHYSAQPPSTEIAFGAPKESVSSGVLSEETTDFSFSSAENHTTSRALPGAALIFLMLGGVVLGVWFLQTPKMEESNETNSGQAQSNQTETNRASSSGSIFSTDAAAQSTPEINKALPTNYSQKYRKELKQRSTPVINKVPPTTLALKQTATPVGTPTIAAKPAASPVKKSTPRSRKTPLKRKRSITIDDILNDQ
jgi:hypothetical protein